jgi:hypothetical protein
MSSTMERRLEAFRNLKKHAWLGRVFARLSAKEIAGAEGFIRARGDDSKDAFELAINRLFIDAPDKPRHWAEISELLSCANSAL